jgi:hypothetical protein
MRTYKNDYSNLGSYSIADCGAFGKAFEAALTGKRCKSAGKVDRWLGKVRLEVKTGAGELGNAGARLLTRTDKVVYCPVPIADAQGYVDPYKQEAFLLTREAFLQALEETAGALREKTSTAGIRKVTIQTFWNRKANKPHGALLYRLLDAMYDHCECTLEELLEG